MDKDESFQHRDAFGFISRSGSLKDKLVAAHDVVKNRLPFIARIALTLYDRETKVLKTYLHSSGEDNPLEHYQASLDNAPSLKEMLKRGEPRVINNMVTFEDGTHEHTTRIGRQGYEASYTLPLFDNSDFLGFLFFNS